MPGKISDFLALAFIRLIGILGKADIDKLGTMPVGCA
jgi:hypothetical protein